MSEKKQQETKEKEKISKEDLIKDLKEDQIKDLTETLQRLQAEFENYKKRIEKEKAEFTDFCKAELIKKLLPIIDNFELALKNEADEEFKKGVELIYAQLFEVLENEGLKPIDCSNKKFDPYCHEALIQEESDKESGTVIEELQKGYLLKDKVIRHAKVKVAK